MLYRLSQEQLSHVIFPIGNMDKNEIRKIAAELNLSVASKKDSQDVCFINGISYQEYIKCFEFGNDYREKIASGELSVDEIMSKPFFKRGEFVDRAGNVLGFHDGIINYTIGQRKGINIAFGERKFVLRIDAEKNQVVLGSNEELMSNDFKIHDIVFSGLNKTQLCEPHHKIFAKLRYRHDPVECDIVAADFPIPALGNLVLSIHLHTPTRAITPGQAAVFYDEYGKVLFGGRIL